jgi:hypothetical protein
VFCGVLQRGAKRVADAPAVYAGTNLRIPQFFADIRFCEAYDKSATMVSS